MVGEEGMMKRRSRSSIFVPSISYREETVIHGVSLDFGGARGRGEEVTRSLVQKGRDRRCRCRCMDGSWAVSQSVSQSVS